MRPKKWHVEVDVVDPGEPCALEVVEVWEGKTHEISFNGEVIARILSDGSLERVGPTYEAGSKWRDRHGVVWTVEMVYGRVPYGTCDGLYPMGPMDEVEMRFKPLIRVEE